MSAGLIRTIVVGGYLGAGKTTMINAFLHDPQGLRALVLVNDFGAINVDADLIENTRGNTMALTNGCACCSIGDSLLEAALSATKTADPPDLLIVEASGVARPIRIANTLMGAAKLAPATCLTLVNGARAARNARDKFVGQLFRSQIETADFLALNRFDAGAMRRFLETCPPVPQVSSIAELLGKGGVPERNAVRGAPPPCPGDGFRSTVISLENPIAQKSLETWLNALPPGVERVKGIVMTRDENGNTAPMVASYTQGLIDMRAATAKQVSGCGSLVLIARKEGRPVPPLPSGKSGSGACQ